MTFLAIFRRGLRAAPEREVFAAAMVLYSSFFSRGRAAREAGRSALARDTADAMSGLIELYEQKGRFDEAQALRSELVERKPGAR